MTGHSADLFRTRLRAVIDAVDPVHRDQVRTDVERVREASGGGFEGLLVLIGDGERDLALRRTACWFLRRLADDQALDALTHVLSDAGAENELRAEAAEALSHIPTPQTLVALSLVASGDAPVAVREAAIWALGRLGDPGAVFVLIDVLERQDEDVQLRASAAEALGAAGDERAASSLLLALRDPAREVRFWAMYALGAVGRSDVIPELEVAATSDPDTLPGWWDLRKEAADAIEQIRRRESWRESWGN
jgi:HEAT repeat protein